MDLGNDSIQCDKRLCFVMDPPRDGGEPKKQEKEGRQERQEGRTESEDSNWISTVLSKFYSPGSDAFLVALFSWLGLCHHVWEQAGYQKAGCLRSAGSCMACEAGLLCFVFAPIFKLQFNVVLIGPLYFPIRLEAAGSSGTKLIPLRPVCVLKGHLVIEPNQVVQIM